MFDFLRDIFSLVADATAIVSAIVWAVKKIVKAFNKNA